MMNLLMVPAIMMLGSHLSAQADAGSRLALTKTGRPACSVVVMSRNEPELLMTRAMEAITGTVRRWGGVDLPVLTLKESARELPSGPAIVLTTLNRLRKVAPEVEPSNNPVMRVAFMDEHGFACVPVKSRGLMRIFVVGRTPRGVFNGAVFLRDFLIDGAKENLYVQPQTVLRSPHMGGRGVYLLTIWGNEDEYSAKDWMTVFDSFARDGMD